MEETGVKRQKGHPPVSLAAPSRYPGAPSQFQLCAYEAGGHGYTHSFLPVFLEYLLHSRLSFRHRDWVAKKAAAPVLSILPL